MNHHCRSWLLFLAIGMLTFPEAVSAQQARTPNSRRPYGSVSHQGDLEQILKDNLERLKDLETLHDMVKRFGRNSNLLRENPLNDEIRKRLENEGGDFDLNDPKNKKWVGELLDQVRDKMGKDKDFRDNMKKQFPDIDNKQFDRFKKLLPADKQQANPLPNNGKMPPGTQPPIGGMQPRPNPPAQPMPEPEPERDFNKTIRDWLDRAEGWEGVGELFRDSPTIREAVDDLTLSLLNAEGSNSPHWLDHLGSMADYADKGSRLFDGFGGLGNIPTPSMPKVNMPNVSVGMPSFKLPSLGAPSPGAGGGFGFGMVLVWIAGVVIVALVVWQLWQRYANPPAPKESLGWHLGPWPVNPGRVATRPELIQAFEYLSLLVLGRAARTWNHLDIATSMGGDATGGSAEQRAAAHQLASLYEQARYAPGAEPFSSDALAAARRNLCFLAGVAAA
jgi:hypothetical protein